MGILCTLNLHQHHLLPQSKTHPPTACRNQVTGLHERDGGACLHGSETPVTFVTVDGGETNLKNVFIIIRNK
jgi:hypothetical protein